jgi:hypothetical protein
MVRMIIEQRRAAWEKKIKAELPMRNATMEIDSGGDT